MMIERKEERRKKQKGRNLGWLSETAKLVSLYPDQIFSAHTYSADSTAISLLNEHRVEHFFFLPYIYIFFCFFYLLFFFF